MESFKQKVKPLSPPNPVNMTMKLKPTERVIWLSFPILFRLGSRGKYVKKKKKKKRKEKEKKQLLMKCISKTIRNE